MINKCFESTFGEDSPILINLRWSVAKKVLEDGGDSIGHGESSDDWFTDSDCTTPAGQLRRLKMGFSADSGKY